MNKLAEINIPNWFEYDELVNLTTIVNEQDPTLALLLAGDNLEQLRPYNPVIRVYLLTLEEGKYGFTKEVCAVTFKSKEEAINFTTKFSSYSTVDLFLDLLKKDFDIVI